MLPHRYHMENEWWLEASREEAAEVLRDTAALVRWWPGVFRDARVLRDGGPHEVGKVAEVRVKGWMPHCMRFEFTVVDANPSWGFTIRARGDFEGTGTCRYAVEDGAVVLRFTWVVEVRRPLVRWLSWFLKPVFKSNHAWAMSCGAESLAYEVARRRAATAEAAARVPAPPLPTFPARGGLRRLLGMPRRVFRLVRGETEGLRFRRRMTAYGPS